MGRSGRFGSEAGWIGYGLLSLALIALIWRVFDDSAQTTQGQGGDGVAAQPAGTGAPAAAGRPDSSSDRRDATWLVLLYGLAGFGYIITATFLPVIARQALPGSPWPDFFWPLFGLAIIPGALIGARAPVRWDNRLLLSGCYALQATGVLLSVASPTTPGLLAGSLLLGLPFTAITLFAMREARRLRATRPPA